MEVRLRCGTLLPDTSDAPKDVVLSELIALLVRETPSLEGLGLEELKAVARVYVFQGQHEEGRNREDRLPGKEECLHHSPFQEKLEDLSHHFGMPCSLGSMG